MPNIKISLITATYNAKNTIRRCIESVIAQCQEKIEFIIVDGGSTDGTLQIIQQYRDHIHILISEPDYGVYDAMNKGIRLASGNVIGTLNSDDYFNESDTLALIAAEFEDENVQILYGNLDYVRPDSKIIRKWRSKPYRKGMFNWGWMPPHPTFYCRSELFKKFGYYRLDYGTAADYELMLRFIHVENLNAAFLNRVIVKMQAGGLSNQNLASRFKAGRFDLKAMRNNSIHYPLFTLLLKPVRKLIQYL